MPTTKKNSVEEFTEINTDDTSSFAESDQREAQLLAKLEAQNEPTPNYVDYKPTDDLTSKLLEILSKQSQTDESIRQILKEVVDNYGKHNPPVPPSVDSPEVKQLKARIAVLRTFYPNTWV